MSITDELREYAQSWRETPNLMNDLDAGDIDGLLGDLEHIADRIDTDYQRSLDEWKAKHGQMWLKGYCECHAELMEGNKSLVSDLESCGWVRLPKDADGEYIHVGDLMEDGKKVARIVLTDGEWEPYVLLYDKPNYLREYFCSEISHYKPTVEDVLLEACKAYHALLIEGMSDVAHDMPAPSEIIAEYAAKLRLADDAE